MAAKKKTPAKKTGSNSQPPKPKKPGTGVSQTRSTRLSPHETAFSAGITQSSVGKNIPVISGADQLFGGSGRSGDRAYVSAVKKGLYGPVKKVPKGAAITGVVTGYGGPGIGDVPTRFTFSKEYAKGAKKGSMTGKAKKKK
jgi:hypothetical protein